MSAALLIRNIGQLLTLAGPPGARRGAALAELGIVRGGALLEADGRIVASGAAQAVERDPLAKDADELDAHGRVAMPGFVDSHTHLVFGPPRLTDFEMSLAGADYHSIAEASGGIRSTMRAVRSRSEEDLARIARRHVATFARHGTTTLEAKSGYGLDRAAELKTLRVLRELDGHPLEIVPTYLGAHIVPPEYDGRANEYLDEVILPLLAEVRAERLAEFVDIYCDRGAFTTAQARRYFEAASAHGFGLRIHAEQFENSGAAQLAVEFGAASADHLEQADAADCASLAASSTVATLLPGSVFHLGLECYAPARELIVAGAAVALASDFNPGSSPTASMPMVLALACRMMRMTPAEAIVAATVNGAYALRRGERLGTLEAGKQADVIVLNAEDYREVPYWFGVNPVALTMKRGRVIYSEGEVTADVPDD